MTQAHALDAVVEHGQMRLRELTKGLFLDKSTPGPVVQTLVKKGYVEQQGQSLQDPDPEIRDGAVDVIRRLARAADSRFRSRVSVGSDACCGPAATSVRASDVSRLH